ncbi:MAG TPA: hypothetical protein VGN26_10345 [Armatimonadota bacterium]|jgi:tetratricopeptide (TPR) repeat protein
MKKILVVVVVCAAILGSAAYGIVSRNQRQAQISSLLSDARTAASTDAGLTTAKSAYDEVISMDPENAEATAGLEFVNKRLDAIKSMKAGQELLAAGDYAGAATKLETCFKSGPLAQASVSLGEAYERQHRLVKAQAAYESAAADDRGAPGTKTLAAHRATTLAALNTLGEGQVQSFREFSELIRTQEMIAKKRNYSNPELSPAEVASVTWDYLQQIDALSGGLQSQAARARAMRLTSGMTATGVMNGDLIAPKATRSLDTWVNSQNYTTDARAATAGQGLDQTALTDTQSSPELQAMATNPPGSNPKLEGSVVVKEQ